MGADVIISLISLRIALEVVLSDMFYFFYQLYERICFIS